MASLGSTNQSYDIIMMYSIAPRGPWCVCACVEVIAQLRVFTAAPWTLHIVFLDQPIINFIYNANSLRF